jgi:hypothetical protein
LAAFYIKNAANHMKKIEINTSKLKLQKEKVADLVEPKGRNYAGTPTADALPTTTVWDHTKIIICP